MDPADKRHSAVSPIVSRVSDDPLVDPASVALFSSQWASRGLSLAGKEASINGVMKLRADTVEQGRTRCSDSRGRKELYLVCCFLILFYLTLITSAGIHCTAVITF